MSEGLPERIGIAVRLGLLRRTRPEGVFGVGEGLPERIGIAVRLGLLRRTRPEGVFGVGAGLPERIGIAGWLVPRGEADRREASA